MCLFLRIYAEMAGDAPGKPGAGCTPGRQLLTPSWGISLKPYTQRTPHMLREGGYPLMANPKGRLNISPFSRTTGIEPALLGVTGQNFNPLSYVLSSGVSVSIRCITRPRGVEGKPSGQGAAKPSTGEI